MKASDLLSVFSKADLEEIYYALADKADRIEKGEYGPEDEEGDDEEWVAQLKEIMERISGEVDV
jgi:hypothetical protein